MENKRNKALQFLNRRGLTVDNIEKLTDDEIEAILQVKDVYYHLLFSLEKLKNGEQILDQPLFYPPKYAFTKRDKDGIVYFAPSVKKLKTGEIEFRCCRDLETQKKQDNSKIVNVKKNMIETFTINYTPHDFRVLISKNIDNFLATHLYSKIDIRPLSDVEKANLVKLENDEEYEIIDDLPITHNQTPTPKNVFDNPKLKDAFRLEIQQVEIDGNKLMEFIKSRNKIFDKNLNFNEKDKEKFKKINKQEKIK